jgi:hypothetical protein
MPEAPVLLVGYNRPDKFIQLIESLRLSKPSKILIAIDGPKSQNLQDELRVSEVLSAVNKIDWTDDIEIRKRPHNLGLRVAMIDAVSWAVSREGKVIVVEDDVIVGPNFTNFCNYTLSKFKDDHSVGQINGWNQVPYEIPKSKNKICRLSLYNTSYAWATWADRWELYDDNLTWATSKSIKEMRNITGSFRSSIQWRINFKNAQELLVDSWSYRWLATMWSHGMSSVTPNSNLITYDGHLDGTHTRTKRREFNNKVDEVSQFESLQINDPIELDRDAEEWLRKVYFDDSIKGLIKTIGARQVLKLLKKIKEV